MSYLRKFDVHISTWCNYHMLDMLTFLDYPSILVTSQISRSWAFLFLVSNLAFSPKNTNYPSPSLSNAYQVGQWQEPISWSEQLRCACVRAFSRTRLFSEWFWHKFWISFKFHKWVSKTYRPKNDIFCFFWYLIIWKRALTWWRFYFHGKKCPKMCLKINWSVKTPWHWPSMGVARSGLWAPACKSAFVAHHRDPQRLASLHMRTREHSGNK